MKTEIFNLKIPEELIAQKPSSERGQDRLLIFDRKTGKIIHDMFYNFANYIPENSCIVLNTTKVIRAKLNCIKKTGGKIELLFTKKCDSDKFLALSRKNIIGQELIIPDGKTVLKCISRIVTGEYLIKVENSKNIFDIFDTWGDIPLPHYIKRRETENIDIERYQTVYAKHKGSIAAPTAGLHFTQSILENLEKKGIIIANIVLHVGWGTFKPVRTENVQEHKMLGELWEITKEEAKKINRARKEGKKIIAVGTTVVRALETSANENGFIHEGRGETELFIYPGYKFKIVDWLLTNFHLPLSTPLILVCAFCTVETIKRIYNEAIKHNYRFYSYGDAMLIK